MPPLRVNYTTCNMRGATAERIAEYERLLTAEARGAVEYRSFVLALGWWLVNGANGIRTARRLTSSPLCPSEWGTLCIPRVRSRKA